VGRKVPGKHRNSRGYQQEKDEKGETMGLVNQNGRGIPGCVRKLLNMERVFLWKPFTNVTVVARIYGNVIESRLVRALEVVRHEHPLVGAKVVFDQRHDAWFSTDNVRPTQYRAVRRTLDQQWFEEICAESKKAFNPEKGPLIRFVLLYSSEVSDLLVFCHHSICDGTALTNLIHEILEAYQSLTSDGRVNHPPIVTNFLNLPDISQNTTFKQPIAMANSQWRKEPHYFDQADFEAVHAAFWQKYRYGMTLIELDAEETNGLAKRCREHGVTVGSAASVALFAGYQKAFGMLDKGPQTISIPFDLRRRAAGCKENAFCFLVGGFRFPFAYDESADFWNNVQRFRNEVQIGVNKLEFTTLVKAELFDPTLIDARSYGLLKETVPEAFSRTSDLSSFIADSNNIAFSMAKKTRMESLYMVSSNIGRLNFPEKYGDLRLDRMYFLPGASPDIPIVLGGVAVGGKMTFSCTYHNQNNESKEVIGNKMELARNYSMSYLGFHEIKEE
jgi:NRPS condensation-like uncharacterized protein